jgi:hypothetical protein
MGAIFAPAWNRWNTPFMLDRDETSTTSVRGSLAVTRRMIGPLSLGVAGATLASEDYRQGEFDTTETQSLHLSAQSLAVFARVDTSVLFDRAYVFAQGGGGAAIAEVTGAAVGSAAGVHAAPLAAVAGGAVVSPWAHLAFVLQGGFESAHVVNLGDFKPESGGFSVALGVRVQGSGAP